MLGDEEAQAVVEVIASGEREFTRFDFQDLLERRALSSVLLRAGRNDEIFIFISARGIKLQFAP